MISRTDISHASSRSACGYTSLTPRAACLTDALSQPANAKMHQMRALLQGRTRRCNFLHNCPGSHRPIRPDSFLLRILHSSRAQDPQARALVPGSLAPVWAVALAMAKVMTTLRA